MRPAVLCSLIAFAALVASARPPAAAGAPFRFGAQGSAAHLAPFTRSAVAPGDTAWTGCGERLTPDQTQAAGSLPFVFSTGSGGSLVAWSDQRSGKEACRASRLDFLGKYPAGWFAGGNLVSSSDSSQVLLSSCTDDAGGGFFAYWDMNPQSFDPHDLYLQHLTSSGAFAAGFAPGGKLMVAGRFGLAGMLPDGSGGIFLGWLGATVTNIRFTRLDASGTPTAGWPADGIDTGIPNTTTSGEAAIDGAGGIYLVWSDGTELKIQRYNSTGVVSGWPALGRTVAAPGSETEPAITRLSNNDALVSWVDPNTHHVLAMRVNAAGSLNLSWPAGGKEISTAIGQQDGPVLLEDTAGGGLILWVQSPPIPFSLGQPFVQHLTSAGAVANGWPAEGVPLSSSVTVYSSYPPSLVSDGAGGAIAAWTDVRGGSDDDVYAQRVLATGAVDPSWTADGVAICAAAGEQDLGAITTDGSGGAIITMLDSSSNPQIRAARLLVDGIVSVLASLVDAAVEPGRVRLHWYTADGSVTLATVERADAGGVFVPVGDITADGVGHLRFEDRDVKAGATYRYRLAVRDGAITSYLGQVTIHVPAAVSFGIDGFRPNPAEGQVSVVFALESAASARLELLDVAGRRVMTREVGMLGAGQHVLPLGQTAALPAGIYVLRLSQSGREAMARAALVR